MAETNVAIKLYKTSSTAKRVGINVTNDTDTTGYALYVNGSTYVVGNIQLTGSGSRYKYVSFYQSSGSNVGYIRYDSGNATNVTSGKFRFQQYSGNATATTSASEYYESFSLPTTAQGLTASADYVILTSKTAVTVAQGGTGATTAANARTNLGIGASGTHADSYFALASHTHSYAGSSSAGGAANLAIKLDHITLNSTTINNTAGSFAFSGSGDPWSGTDWVGLQIGDSADKFQISANSNTIVFRQNDSGGTSTSWSNWVTMLTSANYTSYAASASHTHAAGNITSGTLDAARIPNLSISKITWAASENLSLTAPTANNAEYSIDMPNTTYTGSYWHVWSGKNSASILSCYNDDRHVVVGGALTCVSSTSTNSYTCRNIAYGTSLPSSGTNGDIFILYS